jgi:hypothetical protein
MKSASGWIFKCLREHPEISNKNIKELYFFNKNYNYRKGIKYYYSIFKKAPANTVKGEFTPSYMLSPEVAYRIYKHLPNVKIIACLRNPAERAYSDYRYNIQEDGRFKLYKNFEDTLEKDKEFVERGFYCKQLKPYFELFPSENILVVFFEDLKKNPMEFIQKIYQFLGLKNVNYRPSLINQKLSRTGTYVITYKLPILNQLAYRISSNINQNSLKKKLIEKLGIEKIFFKIRYLNRTKTVAKNEDVVSIPPLKEETRNHLLNNIYGEDIQILENLLKMDLSFWK